MVHGLAALRAASMAMARFSLSLVWPAKSASRRGRSAASNCRSSSLSDAGNDAAVAHEVSAYRTSSSALRNSGSKSFAAAPAALALRTAASAAGRAQPEIQQRRNHVFLDGVKALG